MVLSLKRAHTNTLQTQNDLLLTFLTKQFHILIKKGGSQSPLAKLFGNTPDLTEGTPSKNILKLVTQAIAHLSAPSYRSADSSKQEIQEHFDQYFALKSEAVQLMLSTFMIQVMIGMQMSEALQTVEKVVEEQVRGWQNGQKEGRAYIMLPTAEQKRVRMMHEKALKDILYQFSD